MKLWFGFQPYIQSDLWKDKLNPEKSLLKAVIAAAEVIEIAHSVMTRRERPPKGHIGSKPGPKGNDLSNKAGPVTSSPQPRNNEAWGGLSHSDRARDNPLRPTNERRDQARSSRNNRGRPAWPGTRVTDKTCLSKEEHDRRVAEKLCFGCGEPGHQSRACPHERTVKGSESAKPPGAVTSYSMEIESLQALADATERLDTLTLGSAVIDFEPDKLKDLPALAECDDEDYKDEAFEMVETKDLVADAFQPNDAEEVVPDSLGPHTHLMGDPLARRAEHVLLQGCPYPGDNPDDPKTNSKIRFYVYRTSVTHHAIIDERFSNVLESESLVESRLLLNSSFNLGEW